MIVDILQIITNYSKIRSQLNIIHINNTVSRNVYVYNLRCKSTTRQYDIEKYIFRKLQKLNVNDNYHIIDVSHLNDTLVELYCANSNINQICIDEMKNIKILDCSYNYMIHDVNHMKKLEILYCCGESCGINQNGISNLEIKKIYHTGNNKIFPKN